MRRNAQFCFVAVTISGVIQLNSAGHSNPFTAFSLAPLIYFSICLFSLYPVLFIRLTSTSNLPNTCCLLLLLAFPSTIFSTLNFFHSTSFVPLSLLHFSLSLPLCFRVPRCIYPTYRSSSLSFPTSFHPQSTSITTLPSSFSYFTPSFDSHFNSFVFLFLSFYFFPYSSLAL